VMNCTYRKRLYKVLQKIFKFDKWHISSIKERDYAMYLVKYINDNLYDLVYSKKIIEVGCGLGDIISSVKIKNTEKIGYDLSAKVIRIAKIIHPNCKFNVGSFNEINNEKIAVLIAVNFLHGFDEHTIEEWFNYVIQNNDIDMIVVDKVQTPPYEYSHDYEVLFNKMGYRLSHKSHGFFAWEWSRRHILIFKKDENI
jgi:SAM-dependent methyltransferase